VEGIDHELVRRVATWEREDTTTTKSDENVFTMMRRIGQAKAGLAADYAAQLARNVGKVVFFAKHIDVMDVAEETFAKRGIRYSSIRGDQTTKARQKNIDAFVNDPDVAVIVCSLSAAGVGINLQVASNMVLAELSWTDAEQTQAIDRIHRIGQEQPVTAWRVIASQTIDTRIAELIDSKAGLAARALASSRPRAPLIEVWRRGRKSNRPLTATPLAIGMAGRPESTALQSVASISATRWPPAEWPEMVMVRPKRCQRWATHWRISATMSGMRTAGHRE
jgi:hypothetical protein